MEKVEKKAKKSSVGLKIVKTILIILLVIILIIAAWFLYSSLDKKKAYSAIPSDYSLYVRTDSAWDALEPLLDLQAVDIFLANPSFSSIRSTFLDFRQSKLRNNFFVKKALQRRVDISIYDKDSFLIVCDLGGLSAATRLLPVIQHFINVENLSYIQTDGKSFLAYEKDDLHWYICAKKNLVIVSQNKNILFKACELNNISSYSGKQLATMNNKLTEPFMIAADGKKLIQMFAENLDNNIVNTIVNELSSDELSTIKFGITDSDIELKADFPFSFDEDFENHPVAKIIQKESTTPTLLSKLPSSVQYYTFINIASLEELKDVAFSFMPPKVKINSIWDAAENATEMIFNLTIEDLLFSWTDNEFALCGLEGKADPIIAIKVKDEEKRKHVFDDILSSIIFKSDDSLLIDGIRLPRIELPSFFQNLLNSFGINLPKPYYIVKDGFIYFSQSPENLISVNSTKKGNSKLSGSKNWLQVSKNLKEGSSLSLYYNLERSIPFFLKSKNTFSEILKLYNIGRFDLSTKNNVITLKLQATALKNSSSRQIPGFPISFENRPVPVLHIYENQIYFMEGEKIHSINTGSLAETILTVPGLKYITVTNLKQSDVVLWATCKDGTTTLYDKSLTPVTEVTTEPAICTPVNYEDGILFAQKNSDMLVVINKNGTTREINSNCMNPVTYSPGVSDSLLAVYDKSFLGGIHIIKGETDSFMPVSEISFGSPVFTTRGKIQNVSFITQNGNFYSGALDNGRLIEEDNYMKFELEPAFYLNVKAVKIKQNYQILAALSSDGVLYRIDNSQVLKTKIPHLSAKSGYISAIDYDNDGEDEIFVCGEGNTIYGFRSNLDMIEGFPISGYGIPVFTDINGDGKKDCIVLSLDKKLNAYNLN